MIARAGDPARLRPHIKTHKLPQIVALQVRLGLTKCKCAIPRVTCCCKKRLRCCCRVDADRRDVEALVLLNRCVVRGVERDELAPLVDRSAVLAVVAALGPAREALFERIEAPVTEPRAASAVAAVSALRVKRRCMRTPGGDDRTGTGVRIAASQT